MINTKFDLIVGYKLGARLYMEGGDTGHRQISVGVMLRKDKMDGMQKWNFDEEIQVTLFDQSGGFNHIKKVVVRSPDPTAYQRPIAEMNPDLGLAQLIPLDGLYSEWENYVTDNTMLIEVRVIPKVGR